MGRNKSFFDTYPDEYDILTNATERAKMHRKEVRAIIEKFKPKAVLDAGCATGLTSRLFAAESISATGIDRSKAILEVARSNDWLNNNMLSFRHAHFEDLPKAMRERFDLVVCLANSISGVGTVANLRRSLRNFLAVLTPGGHLVLQMLNYTAIREGEVMPIKATKHGTLVYERFSERRGRKLYLYITRLDYGAKPPAFEIFKHEIDNFSPEQMSDSMKLAGFTGIKRYADLFLSRRFGKSSRDLVITGRKPA
ncbi:MAG: class I SAM-dependent methyltransferase [Candidatus Zixiibacteriota bacterium]|nr:MAG: class I SAM-dependent methyltransferase [candidate division Zixibacteria bacterium]